MQHNPNINNSQHHSNNHHHQQHQQSNDEQIYSNQQYNQQQQYNPLIQGHQSTIQPGGVPVHHPQQFGPHLTGFHSNNSNINNNNINSTSKLLLSGSRNMNSGGEPTKNGRDDSLMLSSRNYSI